MLPSEFLSIVDREIDGPLTGRTGDPRNESDPEAFIGDEEADRRILALCRRYAENRHDPQEGRTT